MLVHRRLVLKLCFNKLFCSESTPADCCVWFLASGKEPSQSPEAAFCFGVGYRDLELKPRVRFFFFS